MNFAIEQLTIHSDDQRANLLFGLLSQLLPRSCNACFFTLNFIFSNGPAFFQIHQSQESMQTKHLCFLLIKLSLQKLMNGAPTQHVTFGFVTY